MPDPVAKVAGSSGNHNAKEGEKEKSHYSPHAEAPPEHRERKRGETPAWSTK